MINPFFNPERKQQTRSWFLLSPALGEVPGSWKTWLLFHLISPPPFSWLLLTLSLISGAWEPPRLWFSHLLSILVTNLCQRMVVSAFLMGIFFGMNCCGSKVLVVLLLSMLLLLYVATACSASFHTVSHVKSLLTSADKFSRACSPALTEPGEESGS